MEIRHLKGREKWKTLPLYESSFPEDRGSYAAYYYQKKCSNNEVFALMDAQHICSMIHLNPYQMWIATRYCTVHYIVAVATDLSYRRKGYMRKLMLHAFSWLYAREEPFTYLMPADTAYYTPFGFQVIYDLKPVSFPEEIAFANQWAKEQFDVVTFRDEAYMDFLREEPETEKEDAMETGGNRNCETTEEQDEKWKPQIMGRIIHIPSMLQCLRSAEKKQICLKIHDSLIPENNGDYIWQVDSDQSIVTQVNVLDSEEDEESRDIPVLELDVKELAGQIFGLSPLHPLLSHLKLLNRICINEEV